MKVSLSKLFLCIICITILFGFYSQGFSQSTYGIEIYPNDPINQCMRCFTNFKTKPKEVVFGVAELPGGILEFKTNHKEWFLSLFEENTDGLAVDVVPKSIFNCEEEPTQLGQIRGTMLKPIFKNAIKKLLKPDEGGFYKLQVGMVPEDLIQEELEFNLVFINKQNLCQYYRTFNLKSYAWDLLEMGMYLDSISYGEKQINTDTEQKYRLKKKTLTFTIPFEKGKTEYSKKDIQPLYDSLNLTDYDITKVDIKAFSSVEGSQDINTKLQKGRANSIVSALQAFQTPTISYQINTDENWVDFFNDLQNSPYHSWAQWSKPRIKGELKGDVLSDFEPLLKKHRKGIVKLELEKKDPYKSLSMALLIESFNNALNEDEIQKAHLLQNSIFERLKATESDPTVLAEMDIPRQKKYLPFFNKNSAFRFLVDQRNILIAYQELEDLAQLDPTDKRVKYNLAALKMRIWLYNWQSVDADEYLQEIQKLSEYGVEQILVERLMVNYHLVSSEKHMAARNYGQKDKSVRYILDRFTSIPLRDSDYLSLAQYLTYYADIEAAKILLAPKMKELEVDEDLLFYYLNLTMVNEDITKEPEYRVIMLNAIAQNKKRYCSLFDASGKGGVTFQLLDNDYLRKTYCESCTQ